MGQILAAMRTWNAVGGSMWRFDTTMGSGDGYGKNCLDDFHDMAWYREEGTYVSGTFRAPPLAVAWTPIPGAYIGNSSDVWFNAYHSWSADDTPAAEEVDLQHVALHELGHVLGSAHTSDSSRIMFYIAKKGSANFRSLKADDANVAQYLYSTKLTVAAETIPASMTAGQSYDIRFYAYAASAETYVQPSQVTLYLDVSVIGDVDVSLVSQDPFWDSVTHFVPGDARPIYRIDGALITPNHHLVSARKSTNVYTEYRWDVTLRVVPRSAGNVQFRYRSNYIDETSQQENANFGFDGEGGGSAPWKSFGDLAPRFPTSSTITTDQQGYPAFFRTVTASVPTCTFSISSPGTSFGASGGDSSFGVNAPSGCAWSASSNVAWITTNSSSSGNGTVTYTVQANGTTSPRSGQITVGGQTHSVSQSGVSCSYSISATGNSFTSSGGNSSFNVSAPSGCSWAASSNVSWITTSSSGSGGGTVSYNVQSNGGTSSRTGQITVGGQTHTVTQGGVSCNYSISSTGNSFTSAGGNSSFSVSAPSGCSWFASSTVSWITTSSSGSADGTVNYSVQSNGGTSSRTGQISVGGQTHTVTQGGLSCYYLISSVGNPFASSGGDGSFFVTTDSGCSWAASSSVSWITTNSSGSGDGTVTYSVQANGSTTSRTGQISVGGQTHSVSQSGASCSYSISPTANSFASPGGNGSFSVSAPSGCSWSASSNVGWITTNSSSSGNGTVTYTVQANGNTSPRSGQITVGGQTHSITQSGVNCSYSISSPSNSFGAAGGNGSFGVSAPSGCSWFASSNVAWITTSSSSSGNGTVNYTVQANGTTSPRSGQITVGGQIHSVGQSGLTPTPTPTPSPSPTPTPSPSPTPTPNPTPTPGPGNCSQPLGLQIINSCVGGCQPGQAITFAPVDYYNPGRFAGSCADTFFWDFGDGTTSNERTPTKTYTSNQNRTVRLTVNPQGGSQVSASITINLGGGSPSPTPNPNPTPTPTPPPGACSVPPTIMQVFITYTGPISGCSAGGTCAQNENITFGVERFDPSYNLGTCQTYEWDFNGVKKNGRYVQHAFTKGGPHTVSVKITVNGASTTLSMTVQIEGQPSQGNCVSDAHTACLLSGRFSARLRYRAGFDGGEPDSLAFVKHVNGFGNANYETAFFYFNSPNNIELLLKVLDQGNRDSEGRPTIALLFGTATPLRAQLLITDTKTGQTRTYESDFGSMRGATDFTAFVRSDPSAPPSPSAKGYQGQTTESEPVVAQGACVPDQRTACLLNRRFRATVRYRAAFDNAAPDTLASVKPVSNFGSATYESAFFFFNDPNNIEILLKILDQGNTDNQGQPTIAVLFGSATPLGTEISITDTTTGAIKTYRSDFGKMQGTTDFAAFPRGVSNLLQNSMFDVDARYWLTGLGVTDGRMEWSSSDANEVASSGSLNLYTVGSQSTGGALFAVGQCVSVNGGSTVEFGGAVNRWPGGPPSGRAALAIFTSTVPGCNPADRKTFGGMFDSSAGSGWYRADYSIPLPPGTRSLWLLPTVHHSERVTANATERANFDDLYLRVK